MADDNTPIRRSGTYPVLQRGANDLASALEAHVFGEKRHEALEMAERLRSIARVLAGFRPTNSPEQHAKQEKQREDIIEELKDLSRRGYGLLHEGAPT